MRNLQARGHPQEQPVVPSARSQPWWWQWPPPAAAPWAEPPKQLQLPQGHKGMSNSNTPAPAHPLGRKNGAFGVWGHSLSWHRGYPVLTILISLPAPNPALATGSQSSSSQMELTKPLTKTIYYTEPLPSLHP